ncbi:16S rRNA (uracil(1498)-N(3))-methyltransferase [Hydrogenophaga sp. BPS33]|uniref:16S rRNA (uracil(1498)-N(3))-methyltransferase n=1 Tax=Hydrogenophaga sp. BPS33 TaxID=2651974 RepID=UPI0013201B73|nr:16S rRNA (uracil(1498)-N(3))-methyltransferase [Hydrogenophaga sp. BPS33]QHE88665.1 16S rRNA (uracil(1498)-N(3))-methyltransferase [Hydrogenophaga sp. BPS33]
MPRFFCAAALVQGQPLALPAATARHVQVLRLQPGQCITLFDGEGGEWDATITRMGRNDVEVTVGAHHATEREPRRAVHLAMGMPANERMDWLVEKAAELGAASLQPLHTAHSVLRLNGERAAKKQMHWQSVAVAACEQCGGNRVPAVHPVVDFAAWLKALPAGDGALRCLLSLADGTRPLHQVLVETPLETSVCFLSGPEGGLNPQEDALARAAGFVPVTLGPRVLRAETAALAALVLAAGG